VAAEESLRAASSFPASKLREPAPWYAVVGAADEAVCEDDAAGYCTLVSLAVSDGEVWGASCGDSGALLVSGGREFLLTEDQRKNPPVGSSAARPVTFSAARHQGRELVAALRGAAWDANGGRLPDDFSVSLLHGEPHIGQNGS